MKLQYPHAKWQLSKLRFTATMFAAAIAACFVSQAKAAISWDSQVLTTNQNPAGSGTQWWFDHLNWSGTGNTPGATESGFLPPSDDNTGAGPTQTEINAGTTALPGGEGVVYDPANDPNFANVGSFNFPAGYQGGQRINQLYISRNTTDTNQLTIKGDLETGNIQVGRSSGQLGVGTDGIIVQTGGLVKVVNQALDIAQTDTSNDGFGNGTYDYRGGSLEVSLTGGSGIRLSHGTTSFSPNGIAGPGGVARFIMHNPSTPGYVKAGTFVFGSFSGTNNGSTDAGDPNGVTRGVAIAEFHYENGGTRPIQTTGNVSINNGFLATHGSTRSARLDLQLSEAPCSGAGCVPQHLGLFDVGGSISGSGDLDGDSITNNDRVLSSPDATRNYYPRSAWSRFPSLTEDDFLVEAAFGSTLYRWEVSYTGLIAWDGDPSNGVVASISGTGGTDIVLIGHSSISAGPAGDHDGNGVVDARDYVVWRKSPGNYGGAQGYTDWVNNFGAGGGGGVAASSTTGAVPEPSSVALALLTALALVSCRRR